jgi:GNAT superfamily N-acetyltransferase
MVRWHWPPSRSAQVHGTAPHATAAESAAHATCGVPDGLATIEPRELISWVHAGAADNSALKWTLEMLEPSTGCTGATGWVVGEVRMGSHRLSAAYTLVLPGRIAMLVGPRVELASSDELPGRVASEGLDRGDPDADERTGGGEEPLVRMLRGLLEKSWQYRPEMLQAVLATDDTHTPGWLLRAGLQPLAVLDQMWLELPLGSGGLAPDVVRPGAVGHRQGWPTKSPGIPVPYSADSHLRWVDLLQASYRGTQDCPELNKYRSSVASLEGYLAGVADKAFRWWRLQIGHEDAACIMLTEALPGHWELVYLGVAPNFRRQGLGRWLLAWGVGQLEALGGASISLAVDQRNRPAVSLYRSMGWRTLQSVSAWFAFPASPSVPAQPSVT